MCPPYLYVVFSSALINHFRIINFLIKRNKLCQSLNTKISCFHKIENKHGLFLSKIFEFCYSWGISLNKSKSSNVYVHRNSSQQETFPSHHRLLRTLIFVVKCLLSAASRGPGLVPAPQTTRSSRSLATRRASPSRAGMISLIARTRRDTSLSPRASVRATSSLSPGGLTRLRRSTHLAQLTCPHHLDPRRRKARYT